MSSLEVDPAAVAALGDRLRRVAAEAAAVAGAAATSVAAADPQLGAGLAALDDAVRQATRTLAAALTALGSTTTAAAAAYSQVEQGVGGAARGRSP